MENNQKWEEMRKDLLSLRELFQNNALGNGFSEDAYENYDFIEREKKYAYKKLEVVEYLLREYFGIPDELYDEETDEWRVFSSKELIERIVAWQEARERQANQKHRE